MSPSGRFITTLFSVISIFVLATFAQPTLADKTYAGLKFGVSKKQVYGMFLKVGVSATNGEKDRGGGLTVIQFDTVLAPVGNADQTLCQFCDDKLFEVQLFWPDKSDFDDCLKSFNQVKNVLVKKYGYPNAGNTIESGLYQTRWELNNGKLHVYLMILTSEANGAHSLTLMYSNKSLDNCSERNKESSKGTSGF